MNHRLLLSLSLPALMLGGSVVGCTQGGGRIASAGDVAPRQTKAADAAAVHAGRALADGRPVEAVSLAETAVAGRPRRADYRLLLGQAYLRAGRFASARQAFADTLQLDTANGRAALNLSLAEVALGDWREARATLDANARTIPAADRGLAVALAGDPAGAVAILTAAARSAQGDVKTRQNLALALALAGEWPQARAVAGTDLSPADLDRRMAQWATFARPTGASDQVAALLGVVPAADGGQPEALALVRPEAPVRAAATAPAEPAPDAPAVAVATPETPSVPLTDPVAPKPAVVAAVVQRLPARVGNRPAAPLRHQAVSAKGGWHVQIGAFRNAAVARDGWQRVLRRDAAFRGRLPEEATFRAGSGVFTRLSVGGLSRGDADAMCRSYRAKGGSCFVRDGAGDQIARWARRDTQLASR